jgi:cyclic pyranopterin phosphate synthase
VAEDTGGSYRSLLGSPHFDARGRAVMVDVGGKPETERVAVARGAITLSTEAFAAVTSGTAAKGDVLGVARIAGIGGAKRTSDLIPLCHPLLLTSVEVRFRLDEPRVEVETVVVCTGPTGVEMEALCAVGAALLTIYDMTKAYGRGHIISDIRLVSKSGGRSGHFRREGEQPWLESKTR